MRADTETRRMDRSTTHELMPAQDCADRGRQSFIMQAKLKLGGIASNGLQDVARRRSGKSDPTREECDRALANTASYAAWTALYKGAQKQMWRAVEDMTARQSVEIESRREAINARPAKGNVELDSAFEIPEYLLNHAFHGQPGGYVNSQSDADLSAGILQEAGGTLYTRGIGSGKSDSKAQAVLRYLEGMHSDFAPSRILDLGCGYGGQTCAYAAAFTDAETHGIDAGEGLLRYAHLRAESLGIALHLKQGDVAATGYPDGHFDLVISNILLHEVPPDVMREIMLECHRLLAPGGIAIHQDVPLRKPDMSGFRKFLTMWQTQHNDEPFWEEFGDSSVPDALEQAGFEPDTVFEDFVPQVAGPMYWYLVGARKS
jgi:ubiquinone/menaquinone biosynthesis C-methylase UbiE